MLHIDPLRSNHCTYILRVNYSRVGFISFSEKIGVGTMQGQGEFKEIWEYADYSAIS